MDITVLLIIVGVIVVEILLSLIIRAAVELAFSWDKLVYYTSQMRLDEGEESRKWRKMRRWLLHSIFAPSSFFAPLLHPIRTARAGIRTAITGIIAVTDTADTDIAAVTGMTATADASTVAIVNNSTIKRLIKGLLKNSVF